MTTVTTAGLVRTTRADHDVLALISELSADLRAARGTPGATADFDPAAWSLLTELGMHRLTAAEDRGGSGASWPEFAALASAMAGAAAGVPLVETDLADLLLAAAGLPGGPELRTVARPDAAGVAPAVGYGRDAAAVVALWQDGPRWRVADVPSQRLVVEPGRDLAGSPSDRVTFDLGDLAGGLVVGEDVARQFRLRGALGRCAQISGGLQRMLDLVLEHVGDREQFGRPIGRFQAVQHLVCDIAGEAALAAAATDTAVAVVAEQGWDGPGTLFAVSVAKSCAGHAAATAVRAAHQVTGAIGTTLEHELHLLTKPILARRNDFGSVDEYDGILTDLAAGAGRGRLFELITGTSGDTVV